MRRRRRGSLRKCWRSRTDEEGLYDYLSSREAPGWKVERVVRKAVLEACGRRLLGKLPDVIVCAADCVRGAAIEEKAVLSAATRRGLQRAAEKEMVVAKAS